jgi:CheY-like chemotaxis protein
VVFGGFFPLVNRVAVLIWYQGICMVDQSEERGHDTNYLGIDEDAETAPMRPTDPLDSVVPWVVELRVIGSASVLQLQLKEPVVMGRKERQGQGVHIDLEPHNGYTLGVSRRHAMISTHGNRVSICDLNSSNGTYLNGGRLEPGRDYRLRHGDHLHLGKLELRVGFVVMPTSLGEQGNTHAAIPVIGSGQRVLIVDDDIEVAGAVASALQRAGFQTCIVTTVTEALTQIEDELPHIIALELMLPDRSGLDLVREIREREDGHQLRLVVISSVIGGYQMRQAIDAGVDMFLLKPVGIDELIRGFDGLVAPSSG